jgi:uncharacterized C2H2 Zn-finger protein
MDTRISEWLASYVGLSTIKNKKEKAKLERKLKELIVDKRDGRVQGPVWAMEPAYQKLVAKSHNYLNEMKKSKEKIDLRIENLLAQQNP